MILTNILTEFSDHAYAERAINAYSCIRSRCFFLKVSLDIKKISTSPFDDECRKLLKLKE
jgi:hypothetical protein